ncbi:MAG: FkbM family methyltransferase, partial [Alphaproteobacteria bacterium]|nr:FkbM family methyltransferase [Alphaproteobacteria bacterium]
MAAGLSPPWRGTMSSASSSIRKRARNTGWNCWHGFWSGSRELRLFGAQECPPRPEAGAYRPHPRLPCRHAAPIFSVTEHEALFASFRFDTVIDVDANIGQFAVTAHCVNPQARVFCFEPMAGYVERLRGLAQDYPRLEIHDYGLGSEASEFEIDVASNSGSSSVLDFTDLQLETYPGVTVIGKEAI